MTQAILVIDMLEDFVTGKLGFEGARRVVQNMKKVADAARARGLPVIYVRDAHDPDDPEMPIWGQHAMAGSGGSEIISELSPRHGEPVLDKHTYSAFFNTELGEVLNEKKVEEVALTGVVTDICIQHSAADAFFRGYKVTVLEDCTAALDEKTYEDSLEFMKKYYAIKTMKSDELIESWGNKE